MVMISQIKSISFKRQHVKIITQDRIMSCLASNSKLGDCAQLNVRPGRVHAQLHVGFGYVRTSFFSGLGYELSPIFFRLSA